MEDLDNWSKIVTAVGAMADRILAGSAFLLLFPPVLAAGFVTVIATMAHFSNIPFSRTCCYYTAVNF
eukprot:6631123-Ditylum_brightwellii.AAC.1